VLADAGLAAPWVVGLVATGAVVLTRRRITPSFLALSFAVGCAIAVVVLAALAWAGFSLGRWLPLVAAPVALAVAGWRIAGRRCRFAGFRPRAMAPALWLLAAFAFLPVVLQAPLVARPLVSFDVASYHVPLARQYAAGGAFLEVAGNFYARLPVGAFLLYAPVVRPSDPSGIEPGVRLLVWCAIAACGLLAGRIAGHLGARRGARLAATALVLWHPMAWDVALQGLSDVWAALFALGAADCLLRGIARREARSLLLGAFLAGSAASVKLSAVGIVFLPLGLLGLAALVRGGRARAPRLAAALALGALLAGGPWAVRATVIGGHPMHPFAGETPDWSAAQAAFVVREHDPLPVSSGRYWRAVASRAATFGYPLAIVPPREDGAGGFSVSALLALALIGGVVGRRRRAVWLLAGASVLGYLAWNTVGLNPARFFMPGALLLAPVGALALSRGAMARRVAGVGLVVLGVAASAIRLPLLAAWDNAAWEGVRDAILPGGLAAEADRLAGEGTLLLLFESRPAWFASPVEWNTVWDVPPWAGELRASADARAFARALQARGVTAVLVNEHELGRFIDFYGGLEGPPRIGGVGARAGSEELAAALAAWPPARHAGFTPDELSRLADFLLLCRRQASPTLSAGPVSEIWTAPLAPTIP
jgi:hypothetical protein